MNKTDVKEVHIHGVSLLIEDDIHSMTRKYVEQELRGDPYLIEKLQFKENDVVIDIGANVGIVSIYLSKKYPNITIYSYEPVPFNYDCFLRNIERNEVKNIFPHKLAVTDNGRPLFMIYSSENTGGSTANLMKMNLSGHEKFIAESTTLDKILQENDIHECRLLKIDCEGSEHEILLNSSLLHNINFLGAEFHINQHLRNQGYSVERLITHCHKHFPKRFRATSLQIAE